jgi:hypothetical protein
MASDFNGLTLTAFRGREGYTNASGLYGLRLVKNHTPSRAFPVRKKSMGLK